MLNRIDPHKEARPGEPLTDHDLLTRIANGIARLVDSATPTIDSDAYDMPRAEIAISTHTVDNADGFLIPGDRHRRVLSVYNSGAVELRFFERKGQSWAEGYPLEPNGTRDLGSSVATIYLRSQTAGSPGQINVFLERGD